MLDLQSPPQNSLPALRHPPLAASGTAIDWHPWLHGWAIFTMVMALVTEGTGSIVTTLRVGMSDPDWPTAPWHLFTISWMDQAAGYLIEHWHRLPAYLAGMCIIGLAAGLGFIDRRPWVRSLGILALGGVIAQGLLGWLRIREDLSYGTLLRITHGCTAHVVVALLGVLALVTSHGWCLPAKQVTDNRQARRLALVLVAVLYLQVIFGAMLRHTDYSPLGQRAHLMLAAVVVALSTWLVLLLRSLGGAGFGSKKLLYSFKGLLTLQVLVGVETWLKRFRNGLFADLQPITTSEIVLRTMHLLIGSLLFASAVTIAVVLYRSVLARTAEPSIGPAEGTA